MSDLNDRDINAELFKAVKKGDINEVKRLISEGADVNAVKDLYTSLYWAAKNNHLNIIEVLLDNGADVDHVNYSMERDVWTLLQEKETEYCKRSLHLAARLGNLEAVEDLLRKGTNVNAQNDTGETPLHFAATYNHKEVVDALLDKGASVNAQDEEGNTPLDLTTNEEIKTLLQNTAELLEAAESGNIQKVNSLINEGANVNATDQNGKTSLHWAAVKGHKEVVETLLGKDGIYVNLADKNKNTPLHSVLKEKKIDIDIVKTLLGAEGIDVNIKDKYGCTPLYWAVLENKIDIVKALPGAQGIDVNIEGKYGKTPLDLATDEEIKTLLIKAAEKTDDGLGGKSPESNEEESKVSEDTDQKTQIVDGGTPQNNEGDPGKEKQGSNAQPESDIIGQDSDNTEPQSDNSKEGKETSNTITGQGTTEVPGMPTENNGSTNSAAQTEEQPSSFFGSLFSILMKPFSLIASFFGGFFSWLFGSNEEKIDESTSQTESQTDANVSLLRSDSLDKKDDSGDHYDATKTDVS